MSAHLEIKHLQTSMRKLSDTLTRFEEEKEQAKSRYEKAKSRKKKGKSLSKAKSRYEELDGICREMRRAIDALEEAQDLLQHGFTDHEVPDPLQHRFTGFEVPYAADLIRCLNLRERLELIAIVNWGQLNLVHAAEVIMAAGVTRASERSLRGEIRKAVKRNPQDWELIVDDTFRYKRFEDTGDESP